MKSFIFILFFIGILLIVIGYIHDNQFCPPPSVEIRYVPQSFEEEYYYPKPILATYSNIFAGSNPWEENAGYEGIYLTPYK